MVSRGRQNMLLLTFKLFFLRQDSEDSEEDEWAELEVAVENCHGEERIWSEDSEAQLQLEAPALGRSKGEVSGVTVG